MEENKVMKNKKVLYCFYSSSGVCVSEASLQLKCKSKKLHAISAPMITRNVVITLVCFLLDVENKKRLRIC